MRKSNGRVSTLDALISKETTGKQPGIRTRNENYRKSKKKYILLLFVFFIFCAFFYFMMRTFHDTDRTDNPPAEISAEKHESSLGLNKKGAAKSTPRKRPVVVIEHREISGKSKGPVNFGTSLEIVAPK